MPPSGVGAKPSRLQRRLSLERAWKQYLGGLDPRGVRDEILSSWLRARDAHRIDPLLPRIPVSLAPEELAERCARDEAFRLAGPVLDAFTRRAKLKDHVLAYFDATGAMLSLEGDPAVAAGLAAIGYCPGTLWSEATAGTNATGIALATGRPIEVFATEHYVAAWQAWSSAAVPVRAPGAADPVGIVAMTGPWEVRRRQALTFVLAVGRAVEERLRAAKGIRDEVVRYAFRAALETGDAIAAVDAQGRVTAANEAAARSSILPEGALGEAAREAVAKALAAPPGRAEAEITLDEAGASATLTPVRYEGARIGAILRIRPAAGAQGSAADRLAARYDFRNILGSSPRLRRAADLAATAARNDLPVVLAGESGTGKELFAHAIHAASARRGRRFMAVNCGSIPAELLEAELFGYEPGTFTGARGEGNPGRFEEADGGTLLLDEVSELAPAAQTALLRVLQEREIVRLGGSQPRAVDVRVIAATNRPLEEELRAGRFRSDLYYRLNVLVIPVPALRERGDDVLELAKAFLAEADVSRRGLTLTADALEALRGHRWSGNVRELKNVILRAAAVATRPEIGARGLVLGPTAVPPRRQREEAPPPPPEPGLERGELVTALDACGWNFRRTAHQLGISRMTLYRWLRKHGISRSAPQSG
jgi:transcriptional regulator of acetoin/glycerol metabolism